MKKLICCLSIFLSFNLLAQMPTESFLSILPYGEYAGINLEGKECVVSVQKTISSQDDVFVFVGTAAGKGKNIKVDNYSVTQYNPEKQDFLLTKRIAIIDDKFLENGIRTYRASNNHLYVATWFVKFASKVEESDKSVCVLSPSVI